MDLWEAWIIQSSITVNSKEGGQMMRFVISIVVQVTVFFTSLGFSRVQKEGVREYRSNVGSAAVEVWKGLRQKFPFHLQTLAYDPENRTLIIAEPPPHVTLQGLKEIAPELVDIQTFQQRIGVDGWVQDIVGHLPELSPTAKR